MALTKSIDALPGLVLEAFKVRWPMLFNSISLDLSSSSESAPAVKGDTIKARVRLLPTERDYDGTSGYQANAAESTDLLVDVPVTLNRHKHVPIKFDHIDLAESRIDLYTVAEEAAFVLGKGAVDYMLGLANTSNFSYSSPYSEANSDKDALDNIAGDMNGVGARPDRRFGIVNTNVYNTLEADSRIASKDYAGQNREGSAYGHLRNVSGFSDIWEYPSMPSNNGAGQTFTAATTDIITATAHGYADGTRVQVSSTTTLPAGLSAATDYYVRDATADTFKVSATDGGAAVDITDTGTGTHTVTQTENLTGFFGTPEGIVLANRPIKPLSNPDPALGRVAEVRTVRDPDTGLTLHLIRWCAVGTFDIYHTITWLYGMSAGRQAGAAASITDKGGHRLVTA